MSRITKVQTRRPNKLKHFIRAICGALALSLALAAPTTAAAQSQARVCVHVPNGTDFDSGLAPFALVIREPDFWTGTNVGNLQPGRNTRSSSFIDANDIALAVNFHVATPMQVMNSDISVALILSENGQSRMDFGYNCTHITLGVSGENFVRSFNLDTVNYLDAVVYGSDDFCADEVYIQRLENGEVIGIRHFLIGDQKCWGDDISGAKYYHTLTGQAVARPDPVFVSASGKWEVVCRTVNCLYTDTTSTTAANATTNTVENTMSSTTSSSISVGLEYEGFSAGAEMTNETMHGVTSTITENISNSLTRSIARTVPYSPTVRREMNIASVWQYSVTSVMDDGSEVVILTDFFGCSANDFAPSFGPGTNESVQSCQGGLVQ